MNEKEIKELRLRIKPDKNNMTHIRGCYVNDIHEIVATFDESVSFMEPDDAQRFFSLFRKTLSGNIGMNLLDLEFTTQQELEGECHPLLMRLKDSALSDEAAVQELYEKIIASLAVEGSYLILIAADSYDVPLKGTDDIVQEEFSDEVFNFFQCCICPVKEKKAALKYVLDDERFHTTAGGRIVDPPLIGFMFPSFNARSTDIHSLLYYTRDLKDNHKELVDALFGTHIPMPSASQLAVFSDILSETLEEECSLEVVSAIKDHIEELVEYHKGQEEDETLTITKRELEHVFDKCGVSDEKVVAFEERYESAFGDDAALVPFNMIPKNKFEVKTPDISIKVSPDRSDLLEMRVIDGEKYILIRAAEGVEVNGVSVTIE